MDIKNANITRRQLKQVAPPTKGVAKRLEQTQAETVGGMCKEAGDRYRSHDSNWGDLRNTAIGGAVVGGVASAIMAANGATGWATAAGCLGGAVAVGCGYFALQNKSERDSWNRFYNDVQSWGGTAAANLSRPGTEAGTVENHAFYEAGAFANVFDVRKDGVVVARHADLASGLKLHEDVKAGTVTAETANGKKVFERASLELPAANWSDSYYHKEDGLLKLTTWGPEDVKVQQTVDGNGSSNVTFNGRSSMQVFPQTQLAYHGTPGTELPNGTLRFEYERDGNDYYKKDFDVLFATPPLTGRDFQADFKLESEPTTTRGFDHGKSVFRTAPQAPLAPNSLKEEPRESALLTNHIPLNGTGAELVETVATGQTDLVKNGNSLLTRDAKLNVYKGLLVEKDVVQDLNHYPAVSLKVDKTEVYIDANDNVKAGSTPARLIDGSVIELGTGDKARKFTIPVPRKSW